MGWLIGGAFLLVILFLAYLFNKIPAPNPKEKSEDYYIYSDPEAIQKQAQEDLSAAEKK